MSKTQEEIKAMVLQINSSDPKTFQGMFGPNGFSRWPNQVREAGFARLDQIIGAVIDNFDGVPNSKNLCFLNNGPLPYSSSIIKQRLNENPDLNQRCIRRGIEFITACSACIFNKSRYLWTHAPQEVKVAIEIRAHEIKQAERIETDQQAKERQAREKEVLESLEAAKARHAEENRMNLVKPAPVQKPDPVEETKIPEIKPKPEKKETKPNSKKKPLKSKPALSLKTKLKFISESYCGKFADFVNNGEWQNSSAKVLSAVLKRVDSDIEQIIQSSDKLPFGCDMINECCARLDYPRYLMHERLQTKKLQKIAEKKCAAMIRSFSDEEFNEHLSSKKLNNLPPLAEKAKEARIDMIIIAGIKLVVSLEKLGGLCQNEGGPLPYSIATVKKRFDASARVRAQFYKKKRERSMLIDLELKPAKSLPNKKIPSAGFRLIKSTAG